MHLGCTCLRFPSRPVDQCERYRNDAPLEWLQQCFTAVATAASAHAPHAFLGGPASPANKERSPALFDRRRWRSAGYHQLPASTSIRRGLRSSARWLKGQTTSPDAALPAPRCMPDPPSVVGGDRCTPLSACSFLPRRPSSMPATERWTELHPPCPDFRRKSAGVAERSARPASAAPAAPASHCGCRCAPRRERSIHTLVVNFKSECEPLHQR